MRSPLSYRSRQLDHIVPSGRASCMSKPGARSFSLDSLLAFSGSMKSVDDKTAIQWTGLARALSKLGYCSRSSAAELIRAGRVTLNGRIRRDPEARVSGEHDPIAV